MNVFTFNNRFEEAIRTGRKWQTCRLYRKDGRARAKVAETVSLRVWTGRPYASKQREIAQALVTEIEAVAIFEDGISFGDGTPRVCWFGEQKKLVVLDSFARRDGFKDWTELRAYFREEGGLPFRGQAIEWRLKA